MTWGTHTPKLRSAQRSVNILATTYVSPLHFHLLQPVLQTAQFAYDRFRCSALSLNTSAYLACMLGYRSGPMLLQQAYQGGCCNLASSNCSTRMNMVVCTPQDVYKTAESIKAAGGKVTREPGPLPGMQPSHHPHLAHACMHHPLAS